MDYARGLLFLQFAQEKLKENKDPSYIDFTPLNKEWKRLGLNDEKATFIIAYLLITSENATTVAKNRRHIFHHFCWQRPKCQWWLLGAIELLIVKEMKLLPKVSLILKSFYDEDVLEESVLLDWFKKNSRKFVSSKDNKLIRESGKGFINWLKEADETSSDLD